MLAHSTDTLKVTTNKRLFFYIITAIILGATSVLINHLITASKNIPPFYQDLAKDLLKISFILLIGWIAIQFINAIEVKLYKQIATLEKKKHFRMNSVYTKIKIIRNTISFIIATITLSAVLMNFNIVKNLGVSLLASAGFLTALVGLAAQKTLSALFTGIQLAASQQIKIGDMVYFDKTRGTIEEISFTHVTVKLSDTKRVIVPASYFIDKVFQNWSRDHEGLKEYIYLNIDWRIPIQPLRERFNQIIQSSPNWNGKKALLQVDELNEYTVRIGLYISADDYDKMCLLKAEIKEEMHTYIRENYPDHLPIIGTGVKT